MINLNGVYLKEGWESFKTGASYKGYPTRTMQYILEDYTQLNFVLMSFIGYKYVTGGRVVTVFPHVCPTAPNLVALDATMDEGVGEAGIYAGGRAIFYAYKINVTYGIREYDQTTSTPNPAQSFPGGPYAARQTIKTADEVIIAPAGSYKYFTSPYLPVDVGFPIFIGREDYVFEVKGFPYHPAEILRAYRNKLNLTTLFGADKGYFLMGPYEIQDSTNPDGSMCWNFPIVFKYRTLEWNQVIRRDTGAADYAVQAGSGAYAYSYIDFGPLLSQIASYT